MRLKSLEMQGFKSFADKTVLSFDDGITAIVGPNGSGKSNISDAVRWVLGEQSTRTLRGAKMEDVIFGGTQKRAQVGFAEVSLTIDNSDGILPLEFNEVVITRRYYRSGESEFFLNRSLVRLRDIHELFMDTGLGRDGYSIIGQGRIAEILSVKSEDRREIFEEASGISKFRHRKEEAERKLSATEENLVRIRDIISELESQVGPLAKQAEDAKKYLKIYDELRILEVSVWLLNLNKIRENAAKYLNDYQIACSQFERAKASLDLAYSEIESLGESMRHAELDISETREKLHASEQEIHEAESNLNLLAAAVENNLQNVERIKSELNDENDRAGGINAQITEKSERIVRLDESAATLREQIEQLGAELSDASRESSDLTTRLDALRAERELIEARANELKISKSAADTYIEGFDSRIAAIDEDIAAKNADYELRKAQSAELRDSYENAKELCESAENMLSGYELKRKSREERKNASAEKLSKARLALESLENKKRMLTDMERDYQGYSNAVKAVMRGNFSGIEGTVSRLMSVEAEYTIAIETILGGALQNIVVADEQTAKKAISYLKSTDSGRATFLPLTSVKGTSLRENELKNAAGYLGTAASLISFDSKYTNVFLSLLGKIAVVDNLSNATNIARANGYSFRIVTLDGQLINAGGSYTGGSVNRTSGILTRANELKKVNDELTKARAAMSALESDAADSEREFTAIAYEIEVYQAEKRKAEDVLLKAGTELSHYKLMLSALSEAIDALEDEKIAFSGKASEQKKLSETCRRDIDELNAQSARVSAGIDEITKNNSELVNRKSEAADKLSDLRMSLGSVGAERSETEKTLAELRALNQSMAGDREQKQALIDEYLAKNQATLAEIDEKTLELAALRKAAEDIAAQIELKNERKLALEAERNKKDRDSKDKNDEILKLERERSRLEARRDSVQGEESAIVDKLWESYELTLATATEFASDIPSVTAANRDISRLKTERRELGTVNVGAIEEYERVGERFEFMSKQRDDLEKAKSELERMIDDVTHKMRDIFTEQFAVINKNFSETFVQMFDGGHAELVLADPSDILNCGIEIQAQPPGKAVKAIMQLSGGEQAFVAIALYFAIMKVRPTPFCVLDEIEAALDDVNVVRFAKYLRSITDKTQFIVITHRRGTMEEADVLYGVTMQEKGVSKMLTISISDVERELKIKLT